MEVVRNHNRIRIPGGTTTTTGGGATSTYSQCYRRFLKHNNNNNFRNNRPCITSSLYRTDDNDVAEVVASTTGVNNERICSPEESDDGRCSDTTDCKDSGYQQSYPSFWNHISKSTFFYELTHKGYVIKRRIGEGSYSKVYYAEHKLFHRNKDKKKVLTTRPIACKIIDRKQTSEGFFEKFLPRELEILKTVSHPHIVQIHSIFQMGPYICICMDFCPMGDLLERIRQHGALSEKRSKLYFHQLCLAISYLHSMNISHRDIKCENVLIHNNACVKLTDFGFSRRLDDLRKPNSCKTFCGSTAYAAPEVLKGIPYDPKLYDMWSLGCVLFIMLCGSMPYDDENILSTIKKQDMHIINFPDRKFISYRAKNIISNLLHPNVDQRLRIEDALRHPWIKS